MQFPIIYDICTIELVMALLEKKWLLHVTSPKPVLSYNTIGLV